MAVISYSDLSSLQEKHPGKKITFCSGSFDLPHAGHVVFLEACKKLGDILVVAVGNDNDIRKNKGPGRPIFNEQIRLKMIDSLKPVDYSFFSNSPAEGGFWLSPVEEILKLLKPSAWVVNYEGGEMEYRKKLAEACGVSFVILKLDRNNPPEYEGVSTTAIIKKIRDAK